jgi:hypothetical protein
MGDIKKVEVLSSEFQDKQHVADDEVSLNDIREVVSHKLRVSY